MSTDPRNISQYRHIRWQNGAMFSRGSLWLADDHLLQITSSGAKEKYQRFYLRDIRALMTGEASTGTAVGGISAALAVLFGLLILGTSGATASIILFAICAVAAIYGFWRGRTIKVFVVTELQTVLLRSVARKWQADKFLAELTPLITAAQADLIRVEPTREEQVADAVQTAVDATANETAQQTGMPVQPELPPQPELPQLPDMPQEQQPAATDGSARGA